MLRSKAIKAIQSFLIEQYEGPISILSAEDDETISPPYAVVRCGSSENIGMGQVDIWEFTILVAVFHDSESTTADTAEANAAEIFAALADPELIEAALAPEIVVSWWDSLPVEASVAEFRWQHVAGFKLVAAPAEE